MPKYNESQIKLRIERVLQRYPTSTSQDVRQRLMLTVKPSYLYSYFVPFYESGRIDDRADIQRAIRAMMKEHLGFSVIAQSWLVDVIIFASGASFEASSSGI